MPVIINLSNRTYTHTPLSISKESSIAVTSEEKESELKKIQEVNPSSHSFSQQSGQNIKTDRVSSSHSVSILSGCSFPQEQLKATPLSSDEKSLMQSKLKTVYRNIAGIELPSDIRDQLALYSKNMEKLDSYNSLENFKKDSKYPVNYVEKLLELNNDARISITPLLMTMIAIKKPELNLKYFKNINEFAGYLSAKNNIDKTQCIINTGVHSTFVECLKVKNFISLIIIDSIKGGYYTSEIYNTLSRELVDTKICRVIPKFVSLGIQKDEYNCTHYALSFASKSSENRPVFDRWHKENFDKTRGECKSLKDVPVNLLKHSQTYGIVKQLSEEALKTLVNKKGDTLEQRILKGKKNNENGKTSISNKRDRCLSQAKKFLQAYF